MEQKPLTAEDYGRLVYQYSLSPHKLAEIGVKMAGQYSFLTGQYIQSKFEYVKYYEAHKIGDDGKKLSDKAIEMMWLMTDEGQKWYIRKKEIKVFEQMSSAIKTATITANQESKL